MKLLHEGDPWRNFRPCTARTSKGGKAVAYVKFFTPGQFLDMVRHGIRSARTRSSAWWKARSRSSGTSACRNSRMPRGPMGLHIERDLHWTPTRRCEEIAPEMFRGDQGRR